MVTVYVPGATFVDAVVGVTGVVTGAVAFWMADPPPQEIMATTVINTRRTATAILLRDWDFEHSTMPANGRNSPSHVGACLKRPVVGGAVAIVRME